MPQRTGHPGITSWHLVCFLGRIVSLDTQWRPYASSRMQPSLLAAGATPASPVDLKGSERELEMGEPSGCKDGQGLSFEIPLKDHVGGSLDKCPWTPGPHRSVQPSSLPTLGRGLKGTRY